MSAANPAGRVGDTTRSAPTHHFPLPEFGSSLIAWQAWHGRRGLPWQGERDPYRVWLSEVMLQQTQVVTVVERYHAFLRRFPKLADLAQASQDDVLALWSGLGYYSRARNLHECAKRVIGEYRGRFPRTAVQLAELPGIGPSTAAAIAAFCFDERVSIFDGNVQRVLARVLGFAGDLSAGANLKALHALAAQAVAQLPRRSSMPRYTQGLMDLGATVCTPKAPRCDSCPFLVQCGARALHADPAVLPLKTKRLKRSAERWVLKFCTRRSPLGEWQVWLAPRPDSGIWAGLHAPTIQVLGLDAPVGAALDAVSDVHWQDLPSFKHVLTHKDLHLRPVWCNATHDAKSIEYSAVGRWFTWAELPQVGLPTAVQLCLNALREALPA